MKNNLIEESFLHFSLTEAQDLFFKRFSWLLLQWLSNCKVRGELEKENDKSFQCRICIDIANGHMSELLETIKSIKEKYGRQVIIMSGNIANPKTYEDYDKAGCDYVDVLSVLVVDVLHPQIWAYIIQFFLF